MIVWGSFEIGELLLHPEFAPRILFFEEKGYGIIDGIEGVGGTYFFMANLLERKQDLLLRHIADLREAEHGTMINRAGGKR